MEMIIKELKNELSYQVRLDAINKIKEYDLNDENYTNIKELIIELALNDRVFAVKQAAFLLCQKNKLQKNGEVINLGKKNTGYSPNDIRKMFLKIKRETEMQELKLDIFKQEFQRIAPKMYDVMFYEHMYFDNWIRGIYKYLSK
ncbi:MAG: hypothetical protein ACRC5W_06470 [Cetobacterium sp.]|uniref:hypothetical protein n=1 Tax=Cetobacterium sp. TaxID=2071632 RepID=UPI003F381CEA